MTPHNFTPQNTKKTGTRTASSLQEIIHNISLSERIGLEFSYMNDEQDYILDDEAQHVENVLNELGIFCE